ncbi:MAG: protease family protein [Acidimicrobiaceae bacterium]|jgi:membrane protease YdiL (CAAX protease family)
MAAEVEQHPVRWGLGDAALGFVLAYVLTIVFAPVVYKLTGQSLDTPSDQLPLRTIALQQVPFYGGMLAVPLFASRRKGSGPVADFGLRMQWADAPKGLLIGIVAQFAANALYLPVLWWTSISTDDISKPARQLTDKAHGAGVVLLILVVVVAAPIVEEIFFRGLVLRSIERRMGTRWAIVTSSALFGAAHFEALQFPALFLFGLVAATLATRTSRLGPGIWAHVAFNLVAVSALLQ